MGVGVLFSRNLMSTQHGTFGLFSPGTARVAVILNHFCVLHGLTLGTYNRFVVYVLNQYF